MEQFVFPCFRVAFPPLRPPVEVPVVAAACVLKQGFHWICVVIVAGALKGYNLRPKGNAWGYDLPPALLKDLEAALASS